MSQQRYTTVQRRGANHTLHIVLTVLTCGLWIPVWIIASMAGRKTKTTTYAPAVQPQMQSTGYSVQQVPQYGQQLPSAGYPQQPYGQQPYPQQQPLPPYRPGWVPPQQ